ncbi:RNA polymerase sigma factor SigF, partial [Nocardia salmonicida]
GEIAERLGISQMGVSRKLSRLLGDLRAQTTDDQVALAV